MILYLQLRICMIYFFIYHHYLTHDVYLHELYYIDTRPTSSSLHCMLARATSHLSMELTIWSVAPSEQIAAGSTIIDALDTKVRYDMQRCNLSQLYLYYRIRDQKNTFDININSNSIIIACFALFLLINRKTKFRGRS